MLHEFLYRYEPPQIYLTPVFPLGTPVVPATLVLAVFAVLEACIFTIGKYKMAMKFFDFEKLSNVRTIIFIPSSPNF